MPGIAVARELRRRDPGTRILFVGAERGIEKRIVPGEGFDLVTLRVGGLNRTGWVRRVVNLAGLAVALVEAWRLVGRFRPDVVVGLGGYASFPVMAAATVRGVPRLVMEQNVFPGLANRVAGRFATRVAVSDPAGASHFGRRAVVTGNPVRPEFKAIPAWVGTDRIRVLVTGGSQGAEAINRAVTEALAHLRHLSSRLSFVHQTGQRQIEEVRAAYRKAGIDAEVDSFFSDFASRYAGADLVVCRAGATTVAEIRASGRAAVFVPLETAADDHQRKNARAMVDANAGVMIDPRDLSGERLAREIAGLVGDPDRIGELGRNARRMAVLDAEAQIVDLLGEIAGSSRI
jgi:UDP-N-acetylglucosamine--N-acetylmuramyl-(pentapeptide) pyrophosphoryl-undecaprenol N-acetylglucosamine transferase